MLVLLCSFPVSRNDTSGGLSPAPSYHTVEPARIENVNEEQAVVPAQARTGGQTNPRSSVARFPSKEGDDARTTLLMAGIWYERTALALFPALSGAQVNAQMGSRGFTNPLCSAQGQHCNDPDPIDERGQYGD